MGAQGQVEQVDIAVVGAGTAGSIVARRAADAGLRVLLVEAGGSDQVPAIKDVARLNELWHTPYDWGHHTIPQAHAGRRRLHLPRGRVLGGSHSLNATIWVRGDASDYDAWVDLGCPGWGWSDVEPVFRTIERWLGPPDRRRGADGLLPVGPPPVLHPVQRSILDAAIAHGLPRALDYNIGTPDGVAPQQVTIEQGHRVSTWNAYAEPVVGHGLQLLTGAVVQRLRMSGQQITGLDLLVDGAPVEVHADTVVLSAGALGSPELLLRSGIGPAAHLAEVGIPVRHDLPGVGAALHDHLLAPVVFGTERVVDPPAAGTSVTQVHWFSRSTPDLAVPDTQPICFSVPMLTPEMAPVEQGFSLMAGLVRTHSRGSLRLAGPEPSDGLLIDLAALEDPRDCAALMASVRECAAVGATAPLAGEWGAVRAHPADLDDVALERYVREHAVTYHHQVGTCSMGTGPQAVVDPALRVHGLEGLLVADASVIPRITSGNTNAPTAMIGERAASFLLAG